MLLYRLHAGESATPEEIKDFCKGQVGYKEYLISKRIFTFVRSPSHLCRVTTQIWFITQCSVTTTAQRLTSCKISSCNSHPQIVCPSSTKLGIREKRPNRIPGVSRSS